MGEYQKNSRTTGYPVRCEKKGTILIVTPLADLDHHLAIQIREQADEWIEQGLIKQLLFDFSRIQFMDSSGIGVIMGRYKKIMLLGGRMVCCSVSKEVDRIMTFSGLYSIMTAYPDRKAAIEALMR